MCSKPISPLIGVFEKKCLSATAGIALAISSFPITALCLTLWFIWGIPSFSVTQDECIECHKITTPTIVKEYNNSIHFQAETSCTGCHGGDNRTDVEEEAHSVQKGFRAHFEPKEIPKMCATCHSDIEKMKFYRLDTAIYNEYLTSEHGKLLMSGDTNVATCISCHGVHRILSRRDPASPTNKLNIPETCGKCHSDEKLMEPYGIPTNQVEEYMSGIHGRILHGEVPGNPALVPTCMDCHGVHGAVPPGLAKIHAVCGTCHFREHRYFMTSPHYESLKIAGTPDCTTCHGNHRNTIPSSFIGAEGKGNCAKCHREGETGYRVGGEFQEIRERADDLMLKLKKETGNGEVSPLLEASYAKAKEKFSELRRITHSLDPEEAEVKLSELEGVVKTYLVYEERVLSKEEDSILTTVLVVGAVFIVFLAALSFAIAFTILRFRQKRERKT